MSRNPLEVRTLPVTGVPVAVGAVRPRQRGDAYLQGIQLGPLPRCRHRPELIIFILDESGSVQGGNDPLGRRHDEVSYTARRIATSCRCGQQRMAVIYFRPSTHDVGPFKLNTFGGVRRVDDALANRPSGTSSDLGPALDAAYALAVRHPHPATVVALTDFELLDADPERELMRLAEFPGHSHAVVLGSRVPQLLEDHDDVTVTRISWDSPAGAVATAVLPAFTHQRAAK